MDDDIDSDGDEDKGVSVACVSSNSSSSLPLPQCFSCSLKLQLPPALSVASGEDGGRHREGGLEEEASSCQWPVSLPIVY